MKITSVLVGLFFFHKTSLKFPLLFGFPFYCSVGSLIFGFIKRQFHRFYCIFVNSRTDFEEGQCDFGSDATLVSDVIDQSGLWIGEPSLIPDDAFRSSFQVAEKRMKAGGSSSNGGQVEWPWLSGSTGVGGVGDEGSRDSRGSWGSQGDDRSLSSTKSRVRSSQSRSSPAAASASAKSRSAAGGVGGGADSLGASKASHDLAPADLLKEKFASIARVSKVRHLWRTKPRTFFYQ